MTAGETDRSSVLYLGPKTQFSATTVESDPTLNFRGHTNGDAVGTFKTSSILLDSSADDLIITGPSGGAISAATNLDAEAGLDVSGGALTVANQAITQTTGGQVTFAGNVDATGGLDVTGGALTIDNQAITQTTGGQVDFVGNVDASGGVDIDADNQSLTIGAGADLTIVHNATNTIATSATGDFVLDNTNVTGSTIMQLGTDTAATDFQVQNNTGTPYLTVTGAGAVDVSDGTLDVPAGTSFLINGVALTTANFTAANMDTLLDGSNADALHTHATVSSSEIKSTGWTETESIPNGGAAAITGNDSVSLADASSGSGDTAVAGISETDTEVTHAGRVEAAIFVASLTLAAGDQVYVSKTAGRLTNDVSGFTTGDTVIPMGIVRDASTYGGTGDDPADIILNIGNTTVL